MKLLRIFLLAALVFPCLANAAKIRQKVVNKKSYCHLGDLFSGNRFAIAPKGKNFLAVKRRQSCLFTVKQRRVSVNGVNLELLNLPLYENGSWWLSVPDWYKGLRPLLYPATVPRQRITSIFIDMGHGGNDPGAIGKISKEKDITLHVGREVAKMLKSYGFTVHLTRNSDIHVPLNQIGTKQQRSGSDLFVSIHVNAAKDRSISGIETFCLTPAGAASSNGGKASKTVFKGNKQDAGNILLAWNIQNSLLKRTGAVDRGIKRARFAVLKDITVPGVLVEIGFISNNAEERRLNDPAYVKKISAGIVDGIAAFCRSTKVRR